MWFLVKKNGFFVSVFGKIPQEAGILRKTLGSLWKFPRESRENHCTFVHVKPGELSFGCVFGIIVFPIKSSLGLFTGGQIGMKRETFILHV
jgi:hypothetical protein